MWIKVIIACLPAAVIGLLFDDKVNELFYNFQTVAIMLILFGIFFIVVENYNKGKNPIANDMDPVSYTHLASKCKRDSEHYDKWR